MKENDFRIVARVTEQEKQKVAALAKKCGLPQTEYVRQRALGYEPNTALPDAFFAVYQKLCDVANQAEINGFAETVKQLNDLIEYTHTRLIKPSQKTTKEIEEEMDEWLRQDFGL